MDGVETEAADKAKTEDKKDAGKEDADKKDAGKEETGKRLKDASAQCLKCYESWKKEQDSGDSREDLMEALHELRKVAARVEIELAIGERREMTAKPIPIPVHRSARRHSGSNNDDIGNRVESRPSGPRPQRSGGSRGRTPRATKSTD